MRNPGRSAWQVDVTWTAAVLAWAAAVVAVVAGAATQATTPALGPMVQATLLEAAFIDMSEAPALEAGAPVVELTDPFEVMRGTGVTVPIATLPDLTVEGARAQVAAALVERRMTLGDAWLEGIDDAALQAELRALDDAVLRPLTESELRRALFPLGLDNGSRAADWATQARQNPGQPVQPIVGVFVRLPVEQVQGAGPLVVGERVVAGLADILLSQGRPAAEAALANVNLSAAMRATLEGPLPQTWRDALDAALRSRDAALAARLDAAREALVEAPASVDPFAAVTGSADLAGATPEEARARTLELLAARGYAGGTNALAAALSDPVARARVAGAGWAFDAASARAHARYRFWAWGAGVVAVLLLLIAALAATGVARVWVPGLAVLLAAAPVWWLAREAFDRVAASSVPPDVSAAGALVALRSWAGWLSASVGGVVGEAVVRVPLIVSAIGVALVGGALLAAVVGWVRPRRRGRF